MSKRIVSLATAVCLVLTAGAALAADEKTAAKSAGTPSHDQMMADWMKIAAPGENHERLKALAGSWKTTVKSWEGPGDPQISEGSCESTMMMDGRYVKEECTGDFGGMPFSGMGVTGYDNQKKKFVGTWIDNMGTGIMTSEGSWDAAKKTLTFHSKMPDMMNLASGKTVPIRMTMKIVDNNSHIFTMYENRGGKETKSMEITYTRK